jgi:lysozyme family protein
VVAINFNVAYTYMQLDERGKDDDPNDRGGRTCDGVTQDEYAAWCRIHKQPIGDVWNISEGTKKSIFYVNYWQPWCDRLPWSVDYLWFDVNVNSGAREATLLLQRAMGFNPRQTDGRIGLYTVQRAIEWPDPEKLIENFLDQHTAFYNELVKERPSDDEYIRGWLNRISHERENALAMLKNARPT